MLCLKVRNTQQYIPRKYVIAARSIALFRNEKGWNFLIKILEYYEVDVIFALDISKWKESISKNESSVALRV
jgi:hypothetical protein